MTPAEADRLTAIQDKAVALRTHMARMWPTDPPGARSWFDFLASSKRIVGNQHNDLSFLATLMAKEYLMHRFDLTPFDAAARPEGANGLDLDLTTRTGQRIVAEIKTTHPYQPGFGANQQKEIDANLRRLFDETAEFKLMLVTDAETFGNLRRPRYSRFAGVEVVNVAFGTQFVLTPDNNGKQLNHR